MVFELFRSLREENMDFFFTHSTNNTLFAHMIFLVHSMHISI